MSENNLPEVKPEKASVDAAMESHGGLVPRSFEAMWRMAGIFAASGMMPKGIDRPESVFVAIQMGLEVGLTPMAAVQNIAVINGRPSIWGDAVLAVCRASGHLEDIEEGWTGTPYQPTYHAYCKIKRLGQKEIIRTFSVGDAQAAGLWQGERGGKDSPWSKYPKRMLQMRARSWALRDGFGDVLKGLRATEEAMDEQPIDVTPRPAAITAPETPPDPEPLYVQIFDLLSVDKNTAGSARVRMFVGQTAKVHGRTEYDVLAVALSNDKETEGFLKAFTAWAEKEYPPEPEKKTKGKKAEPKPAKGDPEPTLDEAVKEMFPSFATRCTNVSMEFYPGVIEDMKARKVKTVEEIKNYIEDADAEWPEFVRRIKG